MGGGGYTTEDARRISWELTAEDLREASRQGGQNNCPARPQRAKRRCDFDYTFSLEGEISEEAQWVCVCATR